MFPIHSSSAKLYSVTFSILLFYFPFFNIDGACMTEKKNEGMLMSTLFWKNLYICGDVCLFFQEAVEWRLVLVGRLKADCFPICRQIKLQHRRQKWPLFLMKDLWKICFLVLGNSTLLILPVEKQKAALV